MDAALEMLELLRTAYGGPKRLTTGNGIEAVEFSSGDFLMNGGMT